jgi:hypothetical protein
MPQVCASGCLKSESIRAGRPNPSRRPSYSRAGAVGVGVWRPYVALSNNVFSGEQRLHALEVAGRGEDPAGTTKRARAAAMIRRGRGVEKLLAQIVFETIVQTARTQLRPIWGGITPLP